MLGGIYSEEDCPLCGQRMTDNGKSVACSRHKTQRANRFIVRFGRRIFRRFTNYDEASRFLTGLRFKKDEGTFDPRDYQPSNPLGFENLAEKWLDMKKSQLKKRSWNNLNNYMGKAIAEWGQRNVKEIQYAEIEDFLFITLAGLSPKSKSNEGKKCCYQ